MSDHREDMTMKYADKARLVTAEVTKVIRGKQHCVDKIMQAILAGGHILIEDIPGVGKTTLALSFARAMDLQQNRVQFTPDVLPSDITGFTMYQKDIGKFVFHPGAVMCNLFLADEINRTSAKTQSALLEVMEESSVTVDGITREVPAPFLVIATENPIGSAGTQMLPESQLDRFMICMVMGYPGREDEVEILREQLQSQPLEEVRPVLTREELIAMQEEVKNIYVHSQVLSYVVELAEATREHELLSLGLSTRGSLAVAAMAKAAAYVKGRDYVIPDDVAESFGDVARHRLKLSTQARRNQQGIDDVMAEILRTVPKPRPEKRSEKRS